MGNPEENRNRTGKGTGEIPDLKLTARTDRFIGKYGRMREIYLREGSMSLYFTAGWCWTRRYILI